MNNRCVYFWAFNIFCLFSVSVWGYSAVVDKDANTLTLTFFINRLFSNFTRRYNSSIISSMATGKTTSTDPSKAIDGEPLNNNTTALQRAENLVWLELCRNMNNINGSGFTYNDNLPRPPPPPDPNAILTEVTTPSTTTPKPRRSSSPFAGLGRSACPPNSTCPRCAPVNRDAGCSLCTFLYDPTCKGVSVTLTQGTLTENVVVAVVTFPAQSSMDATTLLREIKWLNWNQLLTINLWWIPFLVPSKTDPTDLDCSIGYFSNTTLWLIDDPDVGDHTDVTLGAALFSLFISGFAICFTIYYVRLLRASKRYKEAHMFDFDEEDMLES